MKKTSKIIFLMAALASISLFNGCEEIGNIELNVPLVIKFNVSGSETSASDKVAFCLNEYPEWQDNKDKIEKANYFKAAYWTIKVDPVALKGNISFVLKDNINNVLISGTLNDVSPADYMDGKEFEVGQAQIDTFNQYLNDIMLKEDPSCQNPSFNAGFSITDITGGTPYDIDCKVELILKTEVSPD